MTTRISTFSAHSMYVSNMLRTQGRMDGYQMQVNTEQKSQSYAGLGNTSFRLVNLETQRADADHYIQTNQSLELRLNMMQTGMESLRDTVREFRSKLEIFETNNNDGATTQEAVDDIQRWAFRVMEQMQDFLNTQVDGQYIFAGGKTQTAPVDLGLTTLEDFQLDYTGLDPDGSDVNIPDGAVTDRYYPTSRAIHVTSYYQGDDQSMTYRVDNDREIEMGINAIDPAFEKAIRAMGLIAQGQYGTAGGLDAVGNLTSRVEQAMWLLSDSLEANLTSRTSPFNVTEDSNDFESIQRITGFHQVIVNDTMEQHKTYIGFLDIQIDSIEKADMAGAIVHMQDEMRALEASYSTISKLQELSLTNYLR